MRHALFICAAVFIATGCQQANEGVSPYEPLADANMPYDPSIIDLDQGGEIAWQEPSPTQVEVPVAYTQPSTFEPISTGQFHIVRARDTLYGIARQYYNDPRQWKNIYEANRDQLSNPNLIKVGMKLIIP